MNVYIDQIIERIIDRLLDMKPIDVTNFSSEEVDEIMETLEEKNVHVCLHYEEETHRYFIKIIELKKDPSQ